MHFLVASFIPCHIHALKGSKGFSRNFSFANRPPSTPCFCYNRSMPQTPKSNNSQDAPLPEILRSPEFLLGAAEAHQFPNDEIVEVAFAGRSNVGKSSAINAICNRRKLARTSKVPGRTQQINFFSLGDNARLVDLPGYGFAQVPLAVKKKWEITIHKYLAERPNLIILVLLMDIRHPLTALDQQMVKWASDSGLPTQILLTKADKLTRGKAANTALAVEKQLKDTPGQFAVETFSSLNYLGVNEMRAQLSEWVTGS